MMMTISAIAAMSKNWVIGKENQMPWHLPADLRHFKKITLGHPIVMGRKTFQSIGRPLPGRRNIIITREKNFSANGCVLVNSIEDALHSANENSEIFIIGGASLYEQMLPRIQRLYLTLIHAEFEGDTFFPKIDFSEWKELERVDFSSDEENKYDYSFLILERVVHDQ